MFSMRALLLSSFLVLAALSAVAASLADRSPFVQGHWWDPARSGHGFELLNNAGQVAVVWYTYDEAGKPIWYYAQGPQAALGTQPFPLMTVRWADGRAAAPTAVGSLTLKPNHAESIDASWDIGGRTGTWKIQPFVASGVVNENDHTGHWYNPSNSGWGFTLTEQGDVLGAVLYAHDTAGSPTWMAGFGRLGTSRKVDMFTTTGPCPYCAPRAIVNSLVGSLTFDYQSDTALTLRNGTSLGLAAGQQVDGARVTQLGRPASARPADRQLAAFASADALLAYLRDGMHGIGPPVPAGGTGAGSDFSSSPGSAGPAFSPTNVQERDVDEAALVKSDGRFIYSFAHVEFAARLPGLRIVETGPGGAITPRGAFQLGHGADAPAANAGLFLHNGSLVALNGTLPNVAAQFAWLPSASWQDGITDVEIIDARDPLALTSRWRARLDGNLVASRRIGDRLFLVLRYVPKVPDFRHSYFSPSPSNVTVIQATPLSALVPKVRVNGGAPAAVIAPASFYAPAHGSRKAAADMTLLYEIDLATSRVAKGLAIVGGVETVYASSRNLYVATSRATSNPLNSFAPSVPSNATLTDIHRVSLDTDGPRVAGSATLEGFLARDPSLAQFRLSEHEGRLRVVTSTSDAGWWGGDNRNRLTILEPSAVDAGLLKTVGYIPNAARPQTLGMPQETLYATRFVGDRLYAITFGHLRATFADPLYVVDLSNPTDPRIAGELIIPGFSEYLHPMPNGLLLGVGQDVSTAGVRLGMKVSLFDVRNDALPREISTLTIGSAGTTSALLTHHHAFSSLFADNGTGVFAFPARVASVSGGRTLWSWSGLMRFDIANVGGAMQLRRQADLVTHVAVNNPGFPERADPAASTARSILFPDATVYSANGAFWSQDISGQVIGPR